MKPIVYFSKEITPEKVVELFEKLGLKLEGKVACKLHSGEEGNQNYIGPELWEKLINEVDGTVVECNTAYEGARMYTKDHLALLDKHLWTKYFKVDLMDAEGPDVAFDIPNGKTIKKDYVGKNLLNYSTLIVLSHFKGHPMGGFGGALKQLSIGCASSFGKAYIHGAGDTSGNIWATQQELFLSSMADAASVVHKHFAGHIAYISVMKNMSVDCDCCAVAEDPCMKDIGILASLDPIAIDQACLDKVYASDDPGKAHFLERVESRKGVLTIEEAAKLGFGSREYELIEI